MSFQHKSHSATRTPLEIRAKHSRILLYMHRFQIVSSVNSWVALLLRLPPMFRFVRLGVQWENHCDCVSSISLVVQRRTPLEIRQKNSHILQYMHRFRIMSSVNSWVARLLCLPPTFRFVARCAKGEPLRLCFQLAWLKHLSGESRKLTVTISANWSEIR